MKQPNLFNVMRIMIESQKEYKEASETQTGNFFTNTHGIKGRTKAIFRAGRFATKLRQVEQYMQQHLTIPEDMDPLLDIINLIKKGKSHHHKNSLRSFLAYNCYTLLELDKNTPIDRANFEKTGKGSEWHWVRDLIYDTLLPISQSNEWRINLGMQYLSIADVQWMENICKEAGQDADFSQLYGLVQEDAATIIQKCTQILGIDENADENTIKKAYRKCSLKVHPDRNADKDTAGRMFSILNSANEYLAMDNDDRSKVKFSPIKDDDLAFWQENAATFRILDAAPQPEEPPAIPSLG